MSEPSSEVPGPKNVAPNSIEHKGASLKKELGKFGMNLWRNAADVIEEAWGLFLWLFLFYILGWVCEHKLGDPTFWGVLRVRYTFESIDFLILVFIAVRLIVGYYKGIRKKWNELD